MQNIVDILKSNDRKLISYRGEAGMFTISRNEEGHASVAFIGFENLSTEAKNYIKDWMDVAHSFHDTFLVSGTEDFNEIIGVHWSDIIEVDLVQTDSQR